jgi:hypothetical protein
MSRLLPYKLAWHICALVAETMLLFAVMSTQCLAWAQDRSTASLSETIKRVNKGQTELHIFYVHGMGINPPKHARSKQEFDTSEEFRAGFCKKRFLDCSNKIKYQFEKREYAHAGPFDPNAASPDLWYFNEKIWRTEDENGKITNNDWHAATPFVDHFKLTLGNGKLTRKNGTVVHLHEINWWPLILSAKCRQMVEKEASFVGADRPHLDVCSEKTVADGADRYSSYQWIKGNAGQSDDHSPGAAPINRSIKSGVLDWGFADALLALGPINDYLLRGIRELVNDTYLEASQGAKDKKLEFIVITHSLGSYLMFSALDLRQVDPKDNTPHPWRKSFDELLCGTSNAYFMANQIRLLELANLDKQRNGSLVKHLQAWSDARASAKCGAPAPQIDAFSDPSDWLTWQMPETEAAHVVNHSVRNSPHWPWLWLFEYPPAAHLNYDKNPRVLRTMLPGD